MAISSPSASWKTRGAILPGIRIRRFHFVEPQESKTAPFDLHQYDAGGHELAHQHHPQLPYPAASYAKAFFGLVTPMTEAATLVGVSQYLRSEARGRQHAPARASGVFG